MFDCGLKSQYVGGQPEKFVRWVLNIIFTLSDCCTFVKAK